MLIKVSVLMLLAAFQCKGEKSNSTSEGPHCDQFGYEVLQAGMDSINFNMQQDYLRSIEYQQKLKAEMEELRRTLQGTGNYVAVQTKTLAEVQRDLVIMALNVSLLLSDTGKISQTQQVLPTTEMMNDLVLQLLANHTDSKNRFNTMTRKGEQNIPQTCSDVAGSRSGVYRLQPQSGFQESFEAFCDQEYEGGGWTVIQNRLNGSVNFFRGWEAYEKGFGDLRGEFWLGLSKMHELSYSKPHELHIILEDYEGKQVVAKYDSFQVPKKSTNYRWELSVVMLEIL
ncbi:angiopoietin-related protein 7-like [Uranotaenia lowii]|uniref:angiopoietin-related protein 7-like n=1 Tax=Uranotaenia lowii TaxID=190385 RepID=UPI002479EB1D|nr:angiopoietin-related protein 7-like [Uranotaenia lowii]